MLHCEYWTEFGEPRYRTGFDQSGYQTGSDWLSGKEDRIMRPSFYMRKYWVKPGKKRPLCIRVHRKAPSWARSSCNAFLSGKLWQYFVAVHPRRGPGQEKRPFAARYRCHASKMSWFWQDMLPMYSKCPAKRRLGIHLAGILPSRRPFPVRIPQIMHNGQILPRFFDSSFVWELCDSCLRGSLVHDQR